MNRPTFVSPLQPKRLAVNRLLALLTIIFSCDGHFAGGQTPQPSNSERSSATQVTSPTAQFEGSLDKVEVGTLGGWAWDVSRPNVAIKVDVYDGEKLLAAVTAETFRADLKAAQKGDGKHGFDYSLPQSLRDGQSHSISVKFSGTKTDLPGSPKTLLFPKS